MYQVVILTGADPSGAWAEVSENYMSSNAGIPPLGAFSCANALRSAGFTCLVINHAINYTIKEINELLDKVVTDDTLMIGISSTFWNKHVNFNTNNTDNANPKGIANRYDYWKGQGGFDSQVLFRLKKKFSKLKLILGGFDAIANREITGLDFMCIGYSDISIVNVAKYLLYGTAIPNCVKNIFGTVVVDDREAKTHDFNNDIMRWLPQDVVNHTKLPIGIGRGCIFNCTFCSTPMRGKKNLDNQRTATSMATELANNYEKYNIQTYVIVDETFNDSRYKLEVMRDAIKTLNFQPYFWCYARLDLITTRPDTLELLYDIGIRSMFFGLESLNQTTAKAFGKGYSTEKQIATINYIKEKYPDIMLHGNFIVGGPHETVDGVISIAEMLRDGKIQLDSWKFNAMYINPNYLTQWPSDFDLNWQKYGYREKSREGHVLIWENDHMDFYKARQLAALFNGPDYQNNKWGRTYQQVEWYTEPEDISIFLPKYKKQLLELINDSIER